MPGRSSPPDDPLASPPSYCPQAWPDAVDGCDAEMSPKGYGGILREPGRCVGLRSRFMRTFSGWLAGLGVVPHAVQEATPGAMKRW